MPQVSEAVILFPGQGCSVAGSGELVARHCPQLHATSQHLLGADPLECAGDGTRFAQPAIFLASLAGWRAAQSAGVSARAFAGHSLGELSALTAAGVFAPADALELVVLRARLMDEAAQQMPGGMLAVLKGTVEQAEQLATECGLFVANYNAPGQTVLTGPCGGLDAAARRAREMGLRALRLAVSGQFHSPAMSQARAPFKAAVAAVTRAAPAQVVFSSMTAKPFQDPSVELSRALCAPVRWSATISALALDSTTFLDVGPDRVLARLARNNVQAAESLSLEELGACV